MEQLGRPHQEQGKRGKHQRNENKQPPWKLLNQQSDGNGADGVSEAGDGKDIAHLRVGYAEVLGEDEREEAVVKTCVDADEGAANVGV